MSEPKPRKLFNVHAHHTRNTDFDAHVAQWKADGAVRTCVACMDEEWAQMYGYFTNSDLLPYLKKHEDHVIGLAAIRTHSDPDGPDAVDRWRGEGFRGLKLIDPGAPYDDERFFPLYERAEKLGMPILFHTGLLGGKPGNALYARTHSEFMRPWRLEHVARRFPGLKIIGAHLGHPHQVEALKLIMVAPNVHFDLSGGGAAKRWISELKCKLAPFPGANWDGPEENLALQWFQKLCFATDNPRVSAWHAAAEDLMNYLHIPEETRERFY